MNSTNYAKCTMLQKAILELYFGLITERSISMIDKKRIEDIFKSKRVKYPEAFKDTTHLCIDPSGAVYGTNHKVVFDEQIRQFTSNRIANFTLVALMNMKDVDYNPDEMQWKIGELDE